jgi:hypothetical protein
MVTVQGQICVGTSASATTPLGGNEADSETAPANSPAYSVRRMMAIPAESMIAAGNGMRILAVAMAVGILQ